MLAVRDNLAECLSALRAHKLRASLTMLGLTMGVATLITVMTLVQGANVYDIMRRTKLVLTKAAVEALEARFK